MDIKDFKKYAINLFHLLVVLPLVAALIYYECPGKTLRILVAILIGLMAVAHLYFLFKKVKN